jgi:hypothetical protein
MAVVSGGVVYGLTALARVSSLILSLVKEIELIFRNT